MRFTNWHVITGAPCSGKTTVIDHIESLGYMVVPEVARIYITNEIKKGRALGQIKGDNSFEYTILAEKIKIEDSLPEDKMLFLDRAVPDSIAYFKLAGLNTDELIQRGRILRYKKIFLFERLRFEKDKIRTEDEAEIALLDRLLEESYQMLCYNVVHVPVLSTRDRAKYILQRL